MIIRGGGGVSYAPHPHMIQVIPAAQVRGASHHTSVRWKDNQGQHGTGRQSVVQVDGR